LSLDMSEDS